VITQIASSTLIRSGSYSLLIVSPIPNAVIARGHLLAAFVRLAVLWGVILATLIVLWGTLVVVSYKLHCVSSYYYAPCLGIIPDAAQAMRFVPLMLSITLVTISLNALVICSGLAVLLKTRSLPAALGTSIGSAVPFLIAAGSTLWGYFSRAAMFTTVYIGFAIICAVCLAAMVFAYQMMVRAARSG
jgi:hypothetical protein